MRELGITSFGFLAAILVSIHGARVLVIPSSMTSHCMELMSIGRELLNRGHEVTLLTYILDQRSCLSVLQNKSYDTFKIISPDLDASFEEEDKNILQRLEKEVLEGVHWYRAVTKYVNPLTTNLCNALVQGKSILDKLEKEKFDISIVDGNPFYGCLFSIPVHLGIPVVAEATSINPKDMGMPLQTNQVPVPCINFPNDMTFPQRIINTFAMFLEPIFWKMQLSKHDMSPLSSTMKGVDTRQLLKESVLFLENADFLLNYPTAIFPNVVQVGGLTTVPAKPLTPELTEFMDEATHGVVLVCFGTVFKNSAEGPLENLVTALGKLNHKVLYKSTQTKMEGNIKMVQWVPQNDVLGHSKTAMFICHCGANSIWEAVYHGIPVLCLTYHEEEATTASKIRARGIGLDVKMSASVKEMTEAISAVLTNDTIKANMKKISAIFRDRPETPAQRAVSAVEHVIKYGGSHLRPPDVNFVAYIFADVWIIIFLVVFVPFGVSVFSICKCFCNKQAKHKLE